MTALQMREIPERPLPASGRRFIISQSKQVMELLQTPIQPRKTGAFSFLKAMCNLSCRYEAYQDIIKGQNTLTVTQPPRLQAAKNLSELEKQARELIRNTLTSIGEFFGKKLESFKYSVLDIAFVSLLGGLGGGILSGGIAATAGANSGDFPAGAAIGASVSALFLAQLRAASNFLFRMREEFADGQKQPQASPEIRLL